MMGSTRFLAGLVTVALFAGLGAAQDYKDAVFVAMTEPITTIADPVQFNREVVDIRGSYDRGSSFYAFKDGVYWVAAGAGARAGKHVVYTMNIDDAPFTILQRFHGRHNDVDTMSRDTMLFMRALQNLEMTSQSSGLYSDAGLQTSLTLFRLTDLMEPSYFFSAARQSEADGMHSQILKFPEVLVNEGFAFNKEAFTAPQDGIYFFSYSIGLIPNQTFDSVLRANVKPLATLESYSTNRFSKDMISRSGVYRLTAGDKVFVQINKTSKVFSDELRQTSFCGFLYEPVHEMKRAWSVAMTTSWASTVFLAPVPFKDVLVNEGSGWHTKNFMYDCDVTGIYYITFTIGAQAGQPVHVSLFVDAVRQASILRKSTSTNGTDILSRSLILHLKKGNRLYLGAEANTAIFSNKQRQTTFGGLLLFPH